jgi:hypothetical protein
VNPALREGGAQDGVQPGGEAGGQAARQDHLPQGHPGRGQPTSLEQGLFLPQRQGPAGTVVHKAIPGIVFLLDTGTY